MIWSFFSKRMFLSIGADESSEEKTIFNKLFNNDLTLEEITILNKQSEQNKVQLFKDLVEYTEDKPDQDFGNIHFSYDSECVHITFSTPFILKDAHVKYNDIGTLNFTAVFEHSKDFINDLKAFVHCLELHDFEDSE